MTTSATSQGDLFAAPSFETLNTLLGPDGQPPIIIVGCGRRKKRSVAKARRLYVSARFLACRAVAETLSAPYLILSARYGLIAPDTTLDPYDLDLGTLPEESRRVWANSALDYLYRTTDGAPITLLVAGAYAESIMACNAHRTEPLPISAPFAEIETRHHQGWLDQALAMALRIQHLGKLYAMIDQARQHGGTFRLTDLGDQKLPARGVYIFLDPAEQNFMGDAPRIVRIGTHAVSKGSKSSLRNRLRNHLGLSNGSGNHRGSIFRLHVGRAMLEAEGGGERLSSWGLGQAAPAEIRAGEDEHERHVSEYLRRLEVFIVPIDDEPSKDSLRAHVENQLIALCSEEFQTIDKPSPGWLGWRSPMASIVRSGLWNVRDAGRRYKPNGLGSVDYIASLGDIQLHA